MADQFFAIKTRNPDAVHKILAKENGIELDGINVLQEEMRKGTILFVVLGGDKPGWDTGLIGIGTVSKEPYDIGYSKKNYKIKIDMKVVMDSPIKRDALIPYKDCYGIIAIGPQLKGEPNQALTTMTVAQGVALMRAMVELCPNIRDDISELADDSLKNQIFGSVNKMIEIPFEYDESEEDAINRYLTSNNPTKDVLSERRKAFTDWMSKAKKPDGSHYADSMVKGYPVVLETYPKRLEGITLENTNLYYYDDPDTFLDVIGVVKGAANYAEIDKKAFSGGLSAAMSKYYEYLKEKYNDAETDDKTESTDETAIQTKNCLSVLRNPRLNAVHPLNFIIYGAPGTGKTYSTAEYALAIIENRVADTSKKTALERRAVMNKYNSFVKKGQIVFTTFHQSYGYEEFIQGLRPDTEVGGMAFKTIDGTFKKIADTALIDPDNNYVIIIDEINRANISKVFGELITLIEDDKRWGEINETCATLQSGDIFAVPNNLYIVGTMNSADKSISLIDAALRRRFSFIEQQPDDSLVEDSVLRKVLHEMNLILAKELDSTDLLVGHSYFMNRTADNICGILNNSIIPLLYEYFYDNRKKVASILNEVIKKSGANIEIEDNAIGRLRVKTKGDSDDSEQV